MPPRIAREAEIRNPKSEIRKKSETRSPKASRRLGVFRISDFELLSGVGFRPSDFSGPFPWAGPDPVAVRGKGGWPCCADATDSRPFRRHHFHAAGSFARSSHRGDADGSTSRFGRSGDGCRSGPDVCPASRREAQPERCSLWSSAQPSPARVGRRAGPTGIHSSTARPGGEQTFLWNVRRFSGGGKLAIASYDSAGRRRSQRHLHSPRWNATPPAEGPLALPRIASCRHRALRPEPVAAPARCPGGARRNRAEKLRHAEPASKPHATATPDFSARLAIASLKQSATPK